jgi:outer membrane protein
MRLVLMGMCLAAVLAQAEEQTAQRGPLPLSLKRAVELATSPEGNTNVQLSAESLQQAQARSAQSRAALLPSLDGSIGRRDQTTNLSAMGLRFNIPIPGFQIPSLTGPYGVTDARVSASQTVFDFSTIRRFQASKAVIAAAKSDMENTGEAVAAQVARAYMAAIRADADLETAEANVALSEAVQKQAENQKAAGTGTGIEITRARVQLANDKQRLLQTQNARRSAHLRLMRAMGLNLESELQLTDKLQYVPVDAMTLAQARAQALKGRSDLEAQRSREENARLSASATRLERLPVMQAFGDYGSIGPAFDNALPTRTVGITLKVPIFDGGRRDARRVESASQYRAEKARTHDLQEQVELDVRLALDALASADDQVAVSKEGLALAESELNQARRRYDAGVANSLEVTDAQTRLERARDNQTVALYNYNLARVDLAQAMGKVRSMVQ